MALGARPFQLIALVLSGVRVPLVLGLLLGVAGALAWDRAFASRLANNYLANPRALLILASLMASVVVLACFFPVRKATRMNPVVALRHE